MRLRCDRWRLGAFGGDARFRNHVEHALAGVTPQPGHERGVKVTAVLLEEGGYCGELQLFTVLVRLSGTVQQELLPTDDLGERGATPVERAQRRH